MSGREMDEGQKKGPIEAEERRKRRYELQPARTGKGQAILRLKPWFWEIEPAGPPGLRGGVRTVFASRLVSSVMCQVSGLKV